MSILVVWVVVPSSSSGARYLQTKAPFASGQLFSLSLSPLRSPVALDEPLP